MPPPRHIGHLHLPLERTPAGELFGVPRPRFLLDPPSATKTRIRDQPGREERAKVIFKRREILSKLQSASAHNDGLRRLSESLPGFDLGETRVRHCVS